MHQDLFLREASPIVAGSTATGSDESTSQKTDDDVASDRHQIAAISVGTDDGSNRPSSLDLTGRIPSPLSNLPPPSSGSLTDRLERALGSASPLLREIFVDFAPFLSKTLLGSHGQELLIGGEYDRSLKSDGSPPEIGYLHW